MFESSKESQKVGLVYGCESYRLVTFGEMWFLERNDEMHFIFISEVRWLFITDVEIFNDKLCRIPHSTNLWPFYLVRIKLGYHCLLVHNKKENLRVFFLSDTMSLRTLSWTWILWWCIPTCVHTVCNMRPSDHFHEDLPHSRPQSLHHWVSHRDKRDKM